MIPRHIETLRQADLPINDRHTRLLAGHEQSLTPMVLIRDTQSISPDNLVYALINPSDEALNTILEDDPNLYAEQTTLEAFTSNFWRFCDAQHAMSDSDWQTLTTFASEAFKKTDRPFIRTLPSSFEMWLPEDLPVDLVARRLEMIQRHPHPANLRAQVRLAELEMANCFNRDANKSLFDERASRPTWEQRVNETPLDELKEHYANRDLETRKFKADLEVRERSGHPIDPMARDSLLVRETLMIEGNALVNQAVRWHQARQAQRDEEAVDLSAELDDDEPDSSVSMG